MTEEKLPEEMHKQNFRLKVWENMMENDLVNFRHSVYYRIPNFKNADVAAQRLALLEEFKTAKVIKINPDKPQEPVRFLALQANKEILVSIPRLKSGLFLHVTPKAGATEEELRTLSNIQGIQEAGKLLGVDSNIKVDLVVLGSVCVSRNGYRLGKGKGNVDLEFAMMMRIGAITQDTTIVTTVHDCQVVDSLPAELFKEHDIPVDIIVTPTETIMVNPKLRKPPGIIWHLLSERRLKTMQVVQQLKEMDEKEGKVITLKEVESDTETQKFYRNRPKYMKSKRRPNTKRNVSNAEGAVEDGEQNKSNADKPRFPKRRPYRKSKSEGDNNSPSTEVEVKTENSDKVIRQRRKNMRQKSKSHIEFSLKLSNISPDVRVRDLKNALSERGVKPCEITWQGYHGVCYLHFSKLRNENVSPEQPVQVDSIMSSLQQLRIGESSENENGCIIVEPAKPISRIEVTDVTTV